MFWKKSPAVTAAKPRAVSSHNRGMRIGILVVAYNALTTLSAVLKRIPRDVWEAIEEVAVFDDASKDETYELAVGYKAVFGAEKLTIFKNEENLGYGGNQKRGYEYFLKKGFDIVVMLHGDGQYAPEILAHLYAPLVAGEADAVFGSRMMPDYGGPRKGGMPLYKYLGNKILSWYANRALGMRLSEFHSGYRAYSLHALRRIELTQMTNDFHFDTEIIIKLQHQGFRIAEVPIPTYYGTEICYVNGMKYARNVVRAIKRYRRCLRGTKSYPEFAEYVTYYPLKESKYSSHYYCRQFAGKDNDILDVGCGEGFLAAKIARKGNRVVGVDLLDKPRRAAALTQYVRADLDQGLAGVVPALGGQKFDLILLQDVLEHLRAPERMLRDCAGLLKPNGRVLVSLPNVANITVRLALLFGRFEYAPRGILDRTHLRFYTRRSARRLLEGVGYEILERRMTVMPIELALRMSPRNWLMRLANRALAFVTALLPGLFGYQSVFVARPRQEPAATPGARRLPLEPAPRAGHGDNRAAA
jgi:2-polyprenyl-3-methyl-5-hydroxy-6-metoxy-1,4-benzoquinol methylase